MRRFLAALFVALFAPLSASAQNAKPPAAPAALQKEFDGFLVKFRAALKANDGAAVAALTKLPFMDEPDYPDAARFKAGAYPKYFPARRRVCIERGTPIYDRGGDGSDTFMFFCGEQIYGFTKTPSGFLFTDIGVND